VQKSVLVKLARLLLYISIICCLDSHPRIDSVLQKYGFRYGLLENAIELAAKVSSATVDDMRVATSSKFASRKPRD
jgi:hypothetical protein